MALLIADPFARPVASATEAVSTPAVVVRAVTTDDYNARFIGPRNANGWVIPEAPKVPCNTAFA